MFNEETIREIEAAVALYLAATKMRASKDWRDDLTQETCCVLLEGYGGAKVEGKLMFAVQMAATRMGFSNSCQEMTGHDFVTDEGSSPSGRRNTEDDYVSQLEVDDWMDSKLDDTQHFIVKSLLEGHKQFEIGLSLGIAQQTVSDRITEIQEIVKEDFDVN
jgi:hypothetical protein